MPTVVLDTNILIDYLKGFQSAKGFVEQTEGANISVITWIEVLVGTTPQNRQATVDFLNQFEMVTINKAIANVAVGIRKQHRIKLPDAVIWATAKHLNSKLITRNTKDFSSEYADIMIPYEL